MSITQTWSGTVPPLATPWTADVTPANALPDYPRPQCSRPSVAAPRWTNLNGLWQFQPSTADAAVPGGQDLTGRILVPFPPESALSGVMEHCPHMVYRRRVEVPASYRTDGQRVRLNFGAVSYRAAVHVNGTQVAEHVGGYTGFSADITAALTPSGPQEIVVVVHAPVDSETIPVGKQRLVPFEVFYTAASGIWQTVWLEPVPPVSLASVTATPDLATSSFVVTARIRGDSSGAILSVTAHEGDTVVGEVSGSATDPLRLRIPAPHLWSPDDPFRYELTSTLTAADGRTDTVEGAVGMRSIEVAEVAGVQRIMLNGEPTYLLSTLDQGYWPDGLYTAPTDDALRFDLEQTKALGFNTVRKHLKVEPARWYAEADRLGLMVWQDAPSLPTGRNNEITQAQQDAFERETAAMVDQLEGVTSIIGWVAFNEGWGQSSIEMATRVGAQIKAQDPSRLVIDRSGSNCCDTPGDPGTGDIIDWHAYPGPALPVPDASRAAIDGEHGGFSLLVPGHAYPGGSMNPYGSVQTKDGLTDAYVANTTVLRDQGAARGLSGAVYTQITDVENELNGFLTYDRAVLKVDPARVRAINVSTIAAGSSAPPPSPCP